MKKCPYCAEEIQDEAVLCRYCGRELLPPPKPAPPKKTSPSCVAVAAVIFLLIILAVGLFNGIKPAKPKLQPTPTLRTEIIYEITGTSTGASLTWENDTGGTDQGDYKIPFRKVFYGFNRGDFLYISAQNLYRSGTVTCKIYAQSTVIAEATASGAFSIATCSTRRP